MRILLLAAIANLTILKEVWGTTRMRYVSTEHPLITWYNPKFIRTVNFTARRHSRLDPLYYVDFHVDIIWPIRNNVNIDFYLYEYVTNQYKRSFLELRFELCELLEKDLFFGLSFGLFFPHPCPLEPGSYKVDNITVPLKNVPTVVPFTKGRIKSNLTSRETRELLVTGQLDVEIKEVSTGRMKKPKN